MYSSLKLIVQILSIVAVTQLFSWILTRAGLPQIIAQASLSISSNPTIFLLLVSVILLLVGMFLDPVPAVLIFAPILVPAANAMGISPIQFGVVMVTTFCIGLVTPPVGMTLFVASGIAERPVLKVSSKVMPFVITMLVSVVLLILIPGLITWLPSIALA